MTENTQHKTAQLLRVRIEHFRSIEDITIDFKALSVFVGANDSGKSNILRALNLFFNEKTGYNESFNFKKDYNKEVSLQRRKSKKKGYISVRILFGIPKNYTFPSNAKYKEDSKQNFITVVKFWELSDPPKTYFLFGREAMSMPENKLSEERNNQEKNWKQSKIPNLIRHCSYDYIPAIKEQEFFKDLFAKIYRELPTKGGYEEGEKKENFQDSLKLLQLKISSLTKKLEDDVQEITGKKHSIVIPENLEPIFKNLMFTDQREISVFEQRGDGIKVQHIPKFLDFIRSCIDSSKKKFGATTNHIWAIEEPENNLEIKNCYKMRDSFFNILKANKNCQIILTTHSPVFYEKILPQEDAQKEMYKHVDVEENSIKPKITFIRKRLLKINEEGEESKTEILLSEENVLDKETLDMIDREMGIMVNYAKKIKQLGEVIQKQKIEKIDLEKKLNEAKKLNIPIVLVEGKTDVKIFEKLLEIDNNRISKNLNIKFFDSNGQENALRLLNALTQTYLDKIFVAVVDNDYFKNKKSRLEIKKFNKNKNDNTKLFYLKISDELSFLRLPATIENLYSHTTWKKHLTMGFLEERTHADMSDLFGKSDEGFKNLFDYNNNSLNISDEEKLKIKYAYKNKNKNAAAEKICKMNQDEASEALRHIKPIFDEVVEFINKRITY